MSVQQNDQMTLGGVGPGMILLCIPYTILAIILMNKDPQFLTLNYPDSQIFKTIAFVLLAAGIIFWINAVVVFVRNFSKGILITKGPFAICRNPIYASYIFLIIPALAMIFNSGLILSIAGMLYLAFRLSIHGEEKKLERIFGEDYIVYRNTVNRVIPLPRLKNRSKVIQPEKSETIK